MYSLTAVTPSIFFIFEKCEIIVKVKNNCRRIHSHYLLADISVASWDLV